MLTDMVEPPREGNFCDENKNALLPPTVERYKKRTGFVSQND
jgi:hypothetical protein